MTITNTYNPLLNGDPEEVVRRIVDLMPKGPQMSPEEQAQFDEERRAGEARYKEARYGQLPPDTYRILEQGGFVGWTYELEIDGEEITLRHPEGGASAAFRVFGDKEMAAELARAEITRRHGAEVADKAQFRFVWGGCL